LPSSDVGFARNTKGEFEPAPTLAKWSAHLVCYHFFWEKRSQIFSQDKNVFEFFFLWENKSQFFLNKNLKMVLKLPTKNEYDHTTHS
jgi:hypothetical protein